MKESQRIFASGAFRGNARVILLAVVAVLTVLTFIVVRQLGPAKMVARQQASLIDGIERRNPARIQRLVAEHYGDRWGFSRDDLVETMVDAGSQFLALSVVMEGTSLLIDGKHATINAKLVVGGKPVGPAGMEVTRRINQLNAPFVFVWEKQSFLPSSWRLVRMDNVDLPDELYGYEPGDIRRAMHGE